MNIIKDIEELEVGSVLSDVSLKDYTTYQLEGKALGLVIPKDVEGLIILLKYLRENHIKHKILGKGSNLIFSSYYDGILIKLDTLDELEIKGSTVRVGAGYPLTKLSNRLSRLGYTGMEFATGIPGTVGGAIFMNAGAYKSDMGYIVKSIKVLTPRYRVVEMTNFELQFHYRTSFTESSRLYLPRSNASFEKGNYR